LKPKKAIIIISLVTGVFITIFLFSYNNNNNNNNIKNYVFSSKIVHSKVTESFTYENYYNSRYKFSIKYPSDLKKGEESANGDGNIFTNKSGSVKLTVFGNNNVFDTTPKSAYKDALKEVSNISYKIQLGNWYVISWVKNNKIIYKKEVVGKGSINTLILEYPLTQKKLYDTFLLNLNIYFKTPGINEAH